MEFEGVVYKILPLTQGTTTSTVALMARTASLHLHKTAKKKQKGVAQTVQLPDFQVDPEGHDPTTFGL